MKRAPRLISLILLGCLTLTNGWSSEPAPLPLSLHPSNPHYFLFRGQPTILIGSGEHYGAVLNQAFDFRAYFKELKSKGLNHTRLFSGTYREVPTSFGITDNTLAPRPDQFLSPWTRSTEPGEYYGGNKFDLTRWDETFFDRLKRFVRQAGQAGLVVEISLFCPLYDEDLWRVNPMHLQNNINGVGDCPRTEVFTLKHPRLLELQKAVTRKLVTELNGFDNLYYEVCNEPWVGGVTTEWQHEIIATIVAAQEKLPNRHLIGLNLQALNIRDPHPAVAIFNYHHPDSAEPVIRNYALNKVIGDNETGFRGPANFAYRAEAWDCIIAGGGLFSHLDYSFSTRYPAGTLRRYKSPGGGNATLRRQFRVLKEFIHGFDFIHLRPAPEVIKAIEPPGAAVPQTLAQPGQAYAVYLRRRLDVDKISVRWTGTITPPAAGKFTFHTLSTDGVRLWINEREIIANTRQHKLVEDQGEIELQAGKPANVRLEYYETGSNSVAKLLWSGPSHSKSIVPTTHLNAAGLTGAGLRGEYFEDRRMQQRTAMRIEGPIDFVWGKSGALTNVPPQSPLKLNLRVPAGRYQFVWIEPKTGRTLGKSEWQISGDNHWVTAPSFKEDLALRITRSAPDGKPDVH